MIIGGNRLRRLPQCELTSAAARLPDGRNHPRQCLARTSRAHLEQPPGGRRGHREVGLDRAAWRSDAANLQLKRAPRYDEYILARRPPSPLPTRPMPWCCLRAPASQKMVRKWYHGLVGGFEPEKACSAPASTTSAAKSSAAVCLFDDVACPRPTVFGAEGKGFTQVMVGFDFSRALIALQCTAAASVQRDRRSLEYTRRAPRYGLYRGWRSTRA